MQHKLAAGADKAYLEAISCLLPQHLRIGRVCRAKFITGSVAQLAAKPGGGSAWLLGLRDVPYPEAAAALCTLPGIGPKVCQLHCRCRQSVL